MKTTTIVLIIACSLAFVSAFPLDRRDGSVVLDTFAPLERRDGHGQGSGQGQGAQGQGTGQNCEHAGAEHAQSAVCKTFRQCLAVGLPDACTEADIAAQATACVAAGLDKTCSVSALEEARLAVLAAELKARCQSISDLTPRCLEASLDLFSRISSRPKQLGRIGKVPRKPNIISSYGPSVLQKSLKQTLVLLRLLTKLAQLRPSLLMKLKLPLMSPKW
jgi:hypothetical protein